MNKTQRKQLNKIHADLTTLHHELGDRLEGITARLTDMADQLADLRDTAQDSYDSKSDKWQESDKAQAVAHAIDQVDTAHSTLTNLAEALDIMEGLDVELSEALEAIDNASADPDS